MDLGEILLYLCGCRGCRSALPGDRIAVDTVETGEQHPPHVGRISSKSVVSGSGSVYLDFAG